MRGFQIATTLSLFISSPLLAQATLETEPVPTWVAPVAIPATPKPDAQPLRFLLLDQQTRLEPGKIERYSRTVVVIQTAEGLVAGNIAIGWRPDIDRPAIHKLLIRRGDKVIDILAGGQKFTILRREQGLESATLTGLLTATLQIEGLQVGDIMELESTTRSSDPTFGKHVEEMGALWNGVMIGRAHYMLTWPNSIDLKLRSTAGLPPIKVEQANGVKRITLSMTDVEPVISPRGAPARYAIGRRIEATDFRSWGELAAQFLPLYEKAGRIDPTGPLMAEVVKIKRQSASPKARAEAALALVQDQIRYVALQMGTGGLVPTGADATWANRYGDCKAKTAMLTAILHELGIAAVPVFVHSTGDDGLDAKLPMVGLFDHVLVRASIDGRDYWLDGTRNGDRSLDQIIVPAFKWGLPLTGKSAALIRIQPEPSRIPTMMTSIMIDASKGIYSSAPFHVERRFTGDGALAFKSSLSALSEAQKNLGLSQYWKRAYDYVTVRTTSATFDEKTGEQRLVMDGDAKLDWDDTGYLYIPESGLAYDPDFSRPEGPDRQAPFAISYPNFGQSDVIIKLPGRAGVSIWSRKGEADVAQTVAGVAYSRRASIEGDTLRMTLSERSMVPEISFAEAQAAESGLQALNDNDIYLTQHRYEATAADIEALKVRNVSGSKGYFGRGLLFLEANQFPEAEADFTKVLEIDPKNEWALANRAFTYIYQAKLDQAQADVAAAAKIDPTNPVMLRASGTLASGRGDLKGAMAAVTSALARDPGNGFALRLRATTAAQLGDNEVALTDSAELMKRAPLDSEMMLLRVNVLRRMGKEELAAAEVNKFMAAGPTDPYALTSVARVYAAIGQEKKAMDAFESALKIKPESYIYVNRSYSRKKTDLAGRRADVDAALKLSPDDTDALAAKANLLMDASDPKGAADMLGQALLKDPKSSVLLSSRAVAYAKAGQQALAVKDLTLAAQLAKGPTELNSICWSQATAGVNLDQALEACRKAIEQVPGNPAILDSLAFTQLRLGKIDEALANYDKALAISPGQAASLIGRSVVWRRKGDAAKADADRASAEKVSPDIVERFRGYGINIP